MKAYIVREKRAVGGKRVSTPEDVLKYMEVESRLDREIFWVIPLSVQNRVVGAIIPIAFGGTASATITPKGLFRELVRTPLVVSFIVVHNHPGGTVSPSREDKEVSNQLKQGGMFLGLKLLDSIIISHGKFYSLREGGDLS